MSEYEKTVLYTKKGTYEERLEEIRYLYLDVVYTYLYTERYLLLTMRNYTYADGESVAYFARALKELNEAQVMSLDKFGNMIDRLNEIKGDGKKSVESAFDKLFEQLIDEKKKADNELKKVSGKSK